MDKHKNKGKILLIFSIVICITSLYASLNGLHDNALSRSSWFILLLILFISVVNLFRNIKEENKYYSITNILLSITVVVCYILPQLIRYL
ncbi:MAG: hypothetical protein ACRDD7_00490 [Peptostreptococcaceae bacterium]